MIILGSRHENGNYGPTDLRGIPYPVDIGGVHGIAWSAPLILPRDLDIEASREIDNAETTIHFYNPTGVNGIHYCRNPKIVVRSLSEGLTAELIPTEDGAPYGDRFQVVLKDGSGKPQPNTTNTHH